jgi:phosphomannomutase
MQLDEIYQKHGYFLEETISKQFEGREGHQEMEAIMIKFRTAGQEMVPVKSMIDYQSEGTGLPKSNVLKFYLDDHSWFVLRPSGTEPKLKVYFSIADTSAQAAKEKLEYYKAMILEKIRA